MFFSSAASSSSTPSSSSSSLLRPFIRTMSAGSGSTAQTPSQQQHARIVAERQLKPTEVDFMKLIEQRNLLRVTKLRQLRKRNTWTGVAIGGTVIGIYLYSMLAVKQERFLDDFNEPQKVSTTE